VLFRLGGQSLLGQAFMSTRTRHALDPSAGKERMQSCHRLHRVLQSNVLRRWIAAAAMLASPYMAQAGSGYEGEFIPFPEVTIHYYNKDVPPAQQHGSDPLVDFFYTAKYDNWRILSEFLVSADERDLERLIVGRITPDGRQLWFGRNHTDLDQWNRLFHRETYLQTTIHRPGIVEFEDDGGVLPAHITGLSMEDNWSIGETSLNYRITLGLGPTLKEQHLVPYDLLKPNSDSHHLALTAIVSDQNAGDNFKDSGIFFGHAIIPSQASSLAKINQTVVGAYTNYDIGADMILRASAFYVVNDIDQVSGAKKNSSFAYAYLQPEYNLDPAWTFYGRLEMNSGAKNDLYLQQIPSFVSERALAGTRYQLENSQVIKFEVARLRQYGQRFQAAEVQWSAAFP
jgi:hypothetical protein